MRRGIYLTYIFIEIFLGCLEDEDLVFLLNAGGLDPSEGEGQEILQPWIRIQWNTCTLESCWIQFPFVGSLLILRINDSVEDGSRSNRIRNVWIKIPWIKIQRTTLYDPWLDPGSVTRGFCPIICLARIQTRQDLQCLDPDPGYS